MTKQAVYRSYIGSLNIKLENHISDLLEQKIKPYLDSKMAMPIIFKKFW